MIIEPILNRRSVREYKTDAISEELLLEIIEAAQYAPTAHGKHGVEFLVVTNPGLKQQLFEIVGQECIKQAPVLIIPLVDQQKSTLPVQDLTLATAHIFLQATELGLGTVWKNLTADWAEEVRQVLDIPDGYQLINIIPIGVPLVKMSAHAEAEFEMEKIHYEKFI